MTDFDAERRRAWDQYAAAQARVYGVFLPETVDAAATFADAMLAERDKRFPRPKPPGYYADYQPDGSDEPIR